MAETLGILLGAVSVVLGIVAIIVSLRFARAAEQQVDAVRVTAEAARTGVEDAVVRLEHLVDVVENVLQVQRIEAKTATLEDFLLEWLATAPAPQTVGALRVAVSHSRFHVTDIAMVLRRLEQRPAVELRPREIDTGTVVSLLGR